MITKNTIKQIASLRQQKFRKELGLFVVEGRKMVEELLHSDFETVGLYATEAFLKDYPAFDMAEIVSEIQMEQMSGQDTPPGILAVVITIFESLAGLSTMASLLLNLSENAK